MVEKKTNAFAKAGNALKRFFGDRHDPVAIAESKRKQHERIMQQDGMNEFLEAVKHAKSVKVELEKTYDDGFFIFFPRGDARLWCTIGKYKIFCEVFGKPKDKQHRFVFARVYFDKKKLVLDKEIADIIEKRVIELNPHDFEKCKQEAIGFNNKSVFVFSKEFNQR